jgi:transposase-like protein
MPQMTETADELQRRMQSAPDHKKRQRLPAVSLAASGQARHRQAMAALLGVHRHRVAAWVRAYAEGGGDHPLRSQRPRPPVHPRSTAAAFAARPDTLQAPHGFARSHQRRAW